MDNLKIISIMMNGQIATYDGYLPLDSILAYAWMRKHHPDELEKGTVLNPEEMITPTLPLEKRGDGDGWYWACSFALFECLEETKRYWHKRLDQKLAEEYIDFGKRRGTVNVKSSTFKAYRIPLNIMVIPKIEWYAVGDKEEIKSLLSYITHIGKKCSQGFGHVREWIVETTPEDYSGNRPIPNQTGDLEIAIRPPYWLATNVRRCTWNQHK